MDDKKKQQANEKQLVYVGDDTSYWQEIEQRYRSTYPNTAFSFPTIWNDDPDNYHSLFINIMEIRPAVIYLDLSQDMHKRFKLARIIKNEITLRKIPLIGLVDSKKSLKECRAAGIDLAHVKCGEYHDVIYDAYAMAYPSEVVKPNFALAKSEREIDLNADFRIGFVTENGIHVEGNIKLEKGQLVEVETEIPESVLPSNKFIVKEINDFDLYYDCDYTYDLDFVYVDKPELDQNDEDQQGAQMHYKEELADYANRLKMAKRKVKEWVYDRLDVSHGKNIKILIVDKELTIFKEERLSLDKNAFSVRSQTELSDNLDEIQKARPDLVVFQFMLPSEESLKSKKEAAEGEEAEEQESEEENQSLNQLTELVKKVKSIEGYNPFFLVFQCKKYSSKSFQDSFKYPFILANTAPLTFSQIEELANVFQRKQQKRREEAIAAKIAQLKRRDPVKYRRLTSDDFEEKRYYVKKNNDLSHGSTKYSITLQTISESEITFLTDQELKMETYRLTFPVEMSVFLIPDGGHNFTMVGGLRLYKGLIHSINEFDKKELRKYVNGIFFSSVNEKRAKEKEEFEKKKQAYIEKKEHVSERPDDTKTSPKD